ncbi:MAG: histidine kinase dimerization/phospho-acceptor domain-containing protein, partial [Fusobacteriaceae bacterium]
MKKLSIELLKTYFYILLFFVFTHTVSLYFVKLQMNKHIENEVNMVKRFLDIELIQAGDDGKEAFIREVEEALRERPGGEELFLEIVYEGKIYQNENFPELKKISYSHELKILKNIGFYLIHENIVTRNNGSVQYTVLKNLKDDESFFVKLYFYTLSGILLAIVFTLFTARRFMKKLTPQLQQLESINEKIDFDTFKMDIQAKDFYEEFSNFLNSYENMLDRLKQGAEKQKDFISSASHEIKTPLSIIKGYSDILKKRGQKNQEIFFEAIGAIQEESRNL